MFITYQRTLVNSQHSVFSISRNENVRHLICSHNDGPSSATASVALPGNDVTVSTGWQAGLQVLIEVRALVVECNEA